MRDRPTWHLRENDNASLLQPFDDDHTWIVLEDEVNAVVGAAYFGPESHSDRVWNLYFLAVATLLLIETSSVGDHPPA